MEFVGTWNVVKGKLGFHWYSLKLFAISTPQNMEFKPIKDRPCFSAFWKIILWQCITKYWLVTAKGYLFIEYQSYMISVKMVCFSRVCFQFWRVKKKMSELKLAALSSRETPSRIHCKFRIYRLLVNLGLFLCFWSSDRSSWGEKLLTLSPQLLSNGVI